MHMNMIAEREEILAQANLVREEYEKLDARDPEATARRRQLEAAYTGLDRRYRQLNARIKTDTPAVDEAIEECHDAPAAPAVEAEPTVDEEDRKHEADTPVETDEEPPGEDELESEDEAANGLTTEELLDLPVRVSLSEDGADEPEIEMFSDSPFAIAERAEVPLPPLPPKLRHSSRSGLWNSLMDIPEVLVAGLSSFSGGKSLPPTPPPPSFELDALHVAIRNNDEQALVERIESGADLESKDEEGKTPLLAAVCAGHSHLAERLLECDANIESQGGYEHDTALHIAAVRGDHAMVEMLLERGASVYSTNNLGQMPLHLAAKVGHAGIVATLIEHRADVNALTVYNCTPLYLAARQGHVDAARALLDIEAEVNIKDLDGYAALHVAAASGHFAVVRLLVEHGALSGQDTLKENPIELARHNNHHEVAEFLCSAGE